MSLSPLDLAIIAAYFAFSLLVGLAFRSRAGKSLADYFVSGRSLPWWLAGTSMVATTFAADTPLAVAGIVAKEGVAGNWVWWGFLPGALATVYFFAALWHRAGVMTDVELVALRYSGRPARFLRGFRAVYLGVIMNGIIMGWVNSAMARILGRTLDLDPRLAVGLCLAITFAYSLLSGLWGIVVTDAVQFVIAMGGTIALAVFAVDAAGGMDAVVARLAAAPHPAPPPGAPGGVPWGGQPYGDADAVLSFLPSGSAAWSVPVVSMAVFLGFQWWANWYPGAEPGGGGYIAQRLFAAKNERHAVLAGLWFNVAHYALRPWPWIVAGLCGIVLYGNSLTDAGGAPNPENNYIQLMIDHLPAGWRGLLLAAFAAAYMSTISTQLNWGASYLVNDLWRPFVRPDAPPQHYLRAGKAFTAAMLLISLVITFYITSIEGAWKFLLGLGAGTGLVLILRWYWWRVNAWSEIASMVAALATSVALHLFPLPGTPAESLALGLLVTLGVTTAAWIAATFSTAPEPRATLESFCARVHPPGPGWRRIDPAAPAVDFGPRFLAWAASLVMIYGLLFGIGHAIFGRTGPAWACIGATGAAAAALAFILRHRAFQDAAEAARPGR